MVAIPRLDDLSLAVTVDIRGEPRQRSVALPDVRGAPLGHIFGAVPPRHDHPTLEVMPRRQVECRLLVTITIRAELPQRSVALADVLVAFFFNDTATTEIYTLSLHDALPISRLDDLSLAVTVDIRGEPRQRSVALPDVRGAPLGHIFGAVPPVHDHPQLSAIPPRLRNLTLLVTIHIYS